MRGCPRTPFAEKAASEYVLARFGAMRGSEMVSRWTHDPEFRVQIPAPPPSGFPEAVEATKLLYLALQNIAKKCTKPIKDWRKALNQCAIFFEGRVVFHILKTELVHHRSSPKPSTILYRMRRPLCQCLKIYIFIFMSILLCAIFAYIDALWRISTRRGPET